MADPIFVDTEGPQFVDTEGPQTVPQPQQVDPDVELLTKLYGPEKAQRVLSGGFHTPGEFSRMLQQPDYSGVAGAGRKLMDLPLVTGMGDIIMGLRQKLAPYMQGATFDPAKAVQMRDYLSTVADLREAAYQQRKPIMGAGADVFRTVGRAALPMFATGGLGGLPTMAQRAVAAGLEAMGTEALMPVEGGPGTDVAGKTLSRAAMAGAGAAAMAPAVEVAGSALRAYLAPKLAGTRTGQLLGGRAEALAGVKGTQEARQELEQAFAGKPGAAVKEELGKAYQAATREVGSEFNALRAASGNNLNRRGYVMELDKQIGELEKQGVLDEAGEALAADLKKYLASASDSSKDWSFGGMMSSLSNLREGAAVAGEAGKREVAKRLQAVANALEKDMDAAGAAMGAAYKTAKQHWRERVVPFLDPEEGARLIRNFTKNPEPEKAMHTLAISGPDRQRILYNNLTPKGRLAVVAGVFEDAMKEAVSAEGALDSKLLGAALKRREEAFKGFFHGDAATMLDGLKKALTASKAAGPLLGGAAGAALAAKGGGGHVLSAVGALLGSGVGWKGPSRFFTNKSLAALASPWGQKFLTDASKLKAGSKGLDLLVERQMPVLMTLMGVQATKSTAEQAFQMPDFSQPTNMREALP